MRTLTFNSAIGVQFALRFYTLWAAGSTVLERADDSLVEVFPDGSRKIIKSLPAQTPTQPGQRLKIA